MKSFIYLHATDVVAARRFYSELLGLDEIAASDDVVGYRVGTLQLTIARHGDATIAQGWAAQLGWKGGTTAAPSWGIELANDTFATAVERLRAATVQRRMEEPAWVGYWSFPVIDPMGNTVEVSAAARDAWVEN